MYNKKESLQTSVGFSLNLGWKGNFFFEVVIQLNYSLPYKSTKNIGFPLGLQHDHVEFFLHESEDKIGFERETWGSMREI